MKILCPTQKNPDGTPTAAWLNCRVGRITASRLADALKFNKNGDESAKRIEYRAELIAERLTAVPAEHFVSKPMQFGAEYEDDARRAYELHTETMVDQTGFVLHPVFDFAGSSPDGTIGTDGLVEIKVPNTETHLSYLLADVVPEEYKPQMRFNMTCCERYWADFVSFDPRLPKPLQLFVKRLIHDEAEGENLDYAVLTFNESIMRSIDYLRERFGNFALPAAQAAKAQPQEGYLTEEDFAGLT